MRGNAPQLLWEEEIQMIQNGRKQNAKCANATIATAKYAGYSRLMKHNRLVK